MAESERFISFIHQKEALWNFSCKDYKDIDKVNKSWQEVASEMNSTKEEVKAKWSLLRTAYIRELEGVKNGTPSNWSHYSSMGFLENNIFENTFWNEKLKAKSEDDSLGNDKRQSVLKEKKVGEAVDEDEYNYLFLASLHPLMKNLPENKKPSIQKN